MDGIKALIMDLINWYKDITLHQVLHKLLSFHKEYYPHAFSLVSQNEGDPLISVHTDHNNPSVSSQLKYSWKLNSIGSEL